jgi:hypothetical protein
MQNFKTDIHQVTTLAWTLAMASATDQLDVPGEYVWAFPSSDRFHQVRPRSRSIFSSGNSIKDPDVIGYVQGLHLARHLSNPWIVQEFEEAFPSWIQCGRRYHLGNFDLFKYVGFSAGTQESFINFYLFNKHKRFRVFRGDYWWHMDIWSKTAIDWAYIEDDALRSGDICICSYPFALTGDKHEKFDWLVERCNQLGIKLLVDFIYLPNSNGAVDIDLSADCIDQITFSFSKTFPVQCAKIAVRMCKHKPQDPMQMSNDENICNRLSAGLALDIIQQFPVDYNVTKYLDLQMYWCQRLGLKQTKVVHFGLGDDYTNFGRSNQTAWCSQFNEQQNRYNLGMLYENHQLLKKLGLHDYDHKQA